MLDEFELHISLTQVIGALNEVCVCACVCWRPVGMAALQMNSRLASSFSDVRSHRNVKVTERDGVFDLGWMYRCLFLSLVTFPLEVLVLSTQTHTLSALFICVNGMCNSLFCSKLLQDFWRFARNSLCHHHHRGDGVACAPVCASVCASVCAGIIIDLTKMNAL